MDLNRTRTPAVFVGHCAAVLTTSSNDAAHQFLACFAAELDAWRPRAIVVVSAHWMTDPVVMTGEGPLQTIHDHPSRALYDYRYPGHGSAEVAARLAEVLRHAGIDAATDRARGLDHGAWVPLSLLRPRGDLPIVQLSLHADATPPTHVALGAALAPLRDEGVMLLGSGGITHNQEVFRRGYLAGADVATPEPFSRELDAWVSAIVTGTRGSERVRALTAIEEHPLARTAHPTLEHFLPLLVVAAAAGDDEGTKVFEGFQHSLSLSAFRFGKLGA